MNDDAGELLIEKRVERPQTPPYARRVTTDGRFLEYSAQRVEFVNGEWHVEPQPPAWRLQWRLRPEHVEELVTAIRDSGFLVLEAVYRPQGTVIGGSDVVWTASLDGREHTVTLHAAEEVHLPEIEKLEATLERILAEAADASREAGELRG